MTDFPSFKDSGLPQDAVLEKAYALAGHIPRAVGSARILEAMLDDTSITAGHLLAFVTPRLELADIAGAYGQDTSAMVEYIRKYYDEDRDLFKFGGGVSAQASFIACALWDAEQQLSACKGHDLSSTFMKASQIERGVEIRTSTVEDLLRETRRNIEYPYLVLAQNSGFSSVIDQVRQTLKKLDIMIATAPDASADIAAKPASKVVRKP